MAPPFKAVNRGKGLLPDPTAMQILTGLNNPATLKMLLNPLSQGHKQGEEFSQALNQWLHFRFCSGAVDPDVPFCVQASSGQPHQCPCWVTLPSLLPCSRCSFRTRPRPSRYYYLSAFSMTSMILFYSFNPPTPCFLLFPSLPLASISGKSSSVGSGAAQ